MKTESPFIESMAQDILTMLNASDIVALIKEIAERLDDEDFTETLADYFNNLSEENLNKRYPFGL